MTRPEMEDVGLQVGLMEEEGGAPNAMTNSMSFRLEAYNRTSKRTLFEYHNWTNWQPPMLVALAQMLDINVLFYSADYEEFLPVEDNEMVEECDCTENVTFMIFTRHAQS